MQSKRRLAIYSRAQLPSYMAMLSELCLADISAVKPNLLLACGDMLQERDWLINVPILTWYGRKSGFNIGRTLGAVKPMYHLILSMQKP